MRLMGSSQTITFQFFSKAASIFSPVISIFPGKVSVSILAPLAGSGFSHPEADPEKAGEKSYPARRGRHSADPGKTIACLNYQSRSGACLRQTRGRRGW